MSLISYMLPTESQIELEPVSYSGIVDAMLIKKTQIHHIIQFRGIQLEIIEMEPF